MSKILAPKGASWHLFKSQKYFKNPVTNGALEIIDASRPSILSGISVPREQVGFARNYTKDEGRSLGVGLQEQASNHLKLLW